MTPTQEQDQYMRLRELIEKLQELEKQVGPSCLTTVTRVRRNNSVFRKVQVESYEFNTAT